MQGRFYFVLIPILFLGFHAYLILSFDSLEALSFCPIKNQLGIPCPACGGTMAIKQLWQGEVWSSLSTNPLSILAYLISWPLFGLALYDLFSGKKMLTQVVQKIDQRLSIPRLTYFLLAAILLNWLYVLLR